MAERCIAGEFNGSSFLAAQDPDCVRLGINESSIRRRIVACNPAAAAARAAERARVATATAAAEAAHVPARFRRAEWVGPSGGGGRGRNRRDRIPDWGPGREGR